MTASEYASCGECSILGDAATLRSKSGGSVVVVVVVEQLHELQIGLEKWLLTIGYSSAGATSELRQEPALRLKLDISEHLVVVASFEFLKQRQYCLVRT
jgi:VIT1/CCC1 family predicted Fe2+/Mn2+ transporter